jgi:putative phage-type endonuclease
METAIIDLLVAKALKSKREFDSEAQARRLHSLLPISFEGVTPAVLESRLARVKSYRAIKASLDQLPVVEQRTDEWYKMRDEMLTASDWGQALGVGKFGTLAQLYHKKCNYGDAKPFDASAEPLQWGVKYEPVANEVYQLMTNTKVSEYGILRHPRYSYLGASPDGISALGIMLEIKCVWRRKIDGKIPEQYMCQVQGQLEICELEECDYFECAFKECDTLEELREVTSSYKGIILRRRNGDGYAYGKVNDLQTYAQYDEKEFTVAYYYYLSDHMMRRVHRDRKWFEDALPKLRDVWRNIERYRADRSLYDKEVKKPAAKKPPVFIMRDVTNDGVDDSPAR